ncbi:MAG: ABC transporter ATP-binding protein [Candidatus Omnitrophica bacterium]|nr:ABC transporter ATP-binding protein [Candidatus Omnitrophota bacterium]
MNNYIKLLKFLKPHLKIFIIAIVAIFFGSIFQVFQFSMLVPLIDRIFTDQQMILPNPHLPKFITDLVHMINTMDRKVLLKGGLTIFLAGFFLKQIMTVTYEFLINAVSQRVMRDIRYLLYSKIQDLSMEYFSKKRTGELISRITNDVNVVENAVSYACIDLFRQTFMIIFCVITAFGLYPRGAMVIFFVFPLIAIPLTVIGKKLRKISRGTQEKMADINSHLLETISGIRVVKAFCSEKYEKERFRVRNQDFYKLKMKSVRRLIVISPLIETIAGLFVVGVISALAAPVMEHKMSFGILGMFIGSIMLIISPVKKLGNAVALIQQGLAANVRIYEVLDAEVVVKEKSDAMDLPKFSSVIKIDQVDFSYQQESGMVLKGINLEVKSGQVVAIVGPTGTGKTTLVNLIPRFYDSTSGLVSIDGIDIKDVTFKSLRGQIGVVSQEAILFNDTVKANIAYGMPGVTQEQIEDAAKKAFAHLFVMKMPHGYDTIVGDRGFRLSGGEKQRITIARAILKNAPILILDEATSHLDSESEQFIQTALYEFMKGRTVVAIAHRLSTIKKADMIVVIEKGQIVGQGRHEELIENCPLYNKLYTMQFQA